VSPLYAFLSQNAVAFLSGFSWPQPANGNPGAWVHAGTDAPRAVVRAVPVEQLPWWLDDELWEVEIGGALAEDGRAIAAERARLVRRIEAWTAEVANDLISACEQRVRDAELTEYADDVRLYAADADRPAAAAAVAAYIAAHALAGGDKSAAGYDDGFERERRWQVEWLKRHLQL
jgi:hypothetical protein